AEVAEGRLIGHRPEIGAEAVPAEALALVEHGATEGVASGRGAAVQEVRGGEPRYAAADDGYVLFRHVELFPFSCWPACSRAPVRSPSFVVGARGAHSRIARLSGWLRKPARH